MLAMTRPTIIMRAYRITSVIIKWSTLVALAVGQSHLNLLSRHNGPRWIGMMRLIRPNISQLAHMNPQLQFYVEQQRD